jgi:hypothetical protein
MRRQALLGCYDVMREVYLTPTKAWSRTSVDLAVKVQMSCVPCLGLFTLMHGISIGRVRSNGRALLDL